MPAHTTRCSAAAAIFSGDRVLRRAPVFQITPSRNSICFCALLCALGLFLQIKCASAQCAAQDVAGNRRLLDDPSYFQTLDVIQSAAGTPVWKTLKVGTSASKWDLLRDLDAANCSVGDLVEEIFGQPEFVVSPAKVDADLVSVSLAQRAAGCDPARRLCAGAKSWLCSCRPRSRTAAATAVFRTAAGRVPQHRHGADRETRW